MTKKLNYYFAENRLSSLQRKSVTTVECIKHELFGDSGGVQKCTDCA